MSANYDCIIPCIIAEAVLNDLDEHTREREDELCEKFEKHYAQGEQFTKGFDKANDPRPYLYSFMQHWAFGMLNYTSDQARQKTKEVNANPESYLNR